MFSVDQVMTRVDDIEWTELTVGIKDGVAAARFNS